MKINFALLIIALSLLSFMAMAQVDDIPNSEIPSLSHIMETTINEDKPLLFEPEFKNAKRDSIKSSSTTPSKLKADLNKPSSGKEDDALSFNFLYYIIQKFKISDLVDN